MAHEQHLEQDPATRPTAARPERTPDEQRFLVGLSRLRSKPMTEQEENLAIDQAYAIGAI